MSSSFIRPLVVLLECIICNQVIQGVRGLILLSDTPQSRNVSAGTLVEFTCATPEIGLTAFTMTTDIPLVNTMDNDKPLPNGDRQLTLSFIAPLEHQLITISCIATRTNTMGVVEFNQSTAILMIQGTLAAVGDLTSSEVNHCTLNLKITWTAPYTLQGVPINYYTINITRHSDEVVLRSDTTNTTEYLYTVSSLGETLEVVVAAVNGAGTGNASLNKKTSNSSIDLEIVERNRSGSSWTYVLTVVKGEEVICPSGTAIVKFEDEHGVVYDTSANFTQLPNGYMSIVANFYNLPENTLYRPSISVFNDGMILLESSHVNIAEVNANTFDISKVGYTIHPGVINFTVDYVYECESPRQFYVELQCASQTLAMLFNGSSGSIYNVPSNEQCILLVTDGDAMNLINKATAPFSDTIIIESINMSSTTPSPSPSREPPANADQLHVILVFIVIGAVCVVIFVIVLTILIGMLYKTKKCCWATANDKTDVELSDQTRNRKDHAKQKKQPDEQNEQGNILMS